MTISDLISMLEMDLDFHGDIEVYVKDNRIDSFEDPSVHTELNNGEWILIIGV